VQFESTSPRPEREAPPSPSTPDTRTLAAFQRFDDDLAAVLLSGDIRLLDADALRADGLSAFARRQDLEEAEGGDAGTSLSTKRRRTVFLPPDDAARALRAADRRICFVSHPWRTMTHPDPDGATLAALLRFLRDPLGAHVVGVFVDYSCLHQPPRSAGEEASFKAALGVISSGFASPLGTVVARNAFVDECPPHLAACVAVVGAPESAAEALRAALVGAPPGRAVASLDFDAEQRVWRAELGSAAEAAAAVAELEAAPALGDARAVRWYCDRPYWERGWCTLESGASGEMVARLAFFPQLAARLRRLPVKLVEIGGAAPAAVEVVAHAEGAGPRIARIRTALADPEQTHYARRGDREQVARLFTHLVALVGNGRAAHPEPSPACYYAHTPTSPSTRLMRSHEVRRGGARRAAGGI